MLSLSHVVVMLSPSQVSSQVSPTFLSFVTKSNNYLTMYFKMDIIFNRTPLQNVRVQYGHGSLNAV